MRFCTRPKSAASAALGGRAFDSRVKQQRKLSKTAQLQLPLIALRDELERELKEARQREREAQEQQRQLEAQQAAEERARERQR